LRRTVTTSFSVQFQSAIKTGRAAKRSSNREHRKHSTRCRERLTSPEAVDVLPPVPATRRRQQ
jgi:hypothetical protein